MSVAERIAQPESVTEPELLALGAGVRARMMAGLARLRRGRAARECSAAPTRRGDAGLSTVELVAAMAVFGVLMAVAGTSMLSAFSGIRDVSVRADEQASARLAAEWTGRLLRYAEVPEGQTAAITEASPSSITFYTYSGTGPKRDVPYRARLYVVTNTDGSRSLTSEVWTPQAIVGGWTWTGTPMRRTLLTLPATASSPLSVRVWARDPRAALGDAPRVVTPSTSGPLVLNEGEAPESVVVQVGDQGDPRNLVTQQVRLENLQ